MKRIEIVAGTVLSGAVVSGASFALGALWSRRNDDRPQSGDKTSDMWAYYRVLSDAAHEIEDLQPGMTVPRALHVRVDRARRAAAKVERALPPESRWVVDPQSLPTSGTYESIDLAFQYVCLAEEIRSKLERRAADRRRSNSESSRS